jgi:ligand-binding sensor domain-containing protein
MFNVHRLAWCVCFLLFSSAYCFSQSYGYHIEHYNSDDGLPQNSIKGVEMDGNGYIWLATEVGLVRYDGETFKLFNLAEDKKPIRERVRTLYLLNKNDVYVILNDRSRYRVNKWQLLERIANNEVHDPPGKDRAVSWGESIYEDCRLRTVSGEEPEWVLPLTV